MAALASIVKHESFICATKLQQN